MNIDFSAVLVLLTALSGTIWGIDALLFARRRAATRGELPLLVDYAKSFFPIFLIVLVLRSFLVEPFRIPSASMVPTLVEGDFILVNKFAFGIRLPVLNRKIIAIGSPQRGDVIVFRPPHEPEIPYIKRVIAVGGDRVSYRGKQLYVNGKPIPIEVHGSYVGKGASSKETGATVLIENLFDVKHEVLHHPSASNPYQVEDLVIPAGHYFMMGDNRDNSLDSRAWGLVPDRNLIGKAFFIWLHWEGWLKFDFARIGTSID
ncbi:MAG: signal peptidase I [Gammaproteobacteria bacterium]|nr:signal peptidase I [Gammaproteobacteria bacterium]